MTATALAHGPSVRTDLSWLRVLVVDDEPQVFQAIRQTLRDKGVGRTFSAEDGPEGLQILRSPVIRSTSW